MRWKKWKMAFHPDKCNILSVTQNKNLIKFNYTLHGYLLNSLEEVKSLGLTIRQDLKWKSCVNNICTRTNKTLGFLCQMSSVKEQAYKSLVRQSLEYTCSTIKAKSTNLKWSNTGSQGSSPDTEMHLVLATCDKAWTGGLEDRRKDAWFVKTANENVGITETRQT